MEDFLDPQNAVGMPEQADSLFALDFLLTAKTGVRNCAVALTEAATPEARAVIHNQLNEALQLHEEISALMMEKGWFHPYNVDHQFHMDLKASKTTVQIAGLKLFPEDTARLGLFPTVPDR